jgi:Trypsin
MHSRVERNGEHFRTIYYENHPKFMNTTHYDDYDMALATVDRSMSFNRNIKPICFPDVSDSFVGIKATVAGW